MIDGFITDLEDTFGKYKHGMRTAIEEKLSDITENDSDDLLRFLTEDYDMARPPSLKVIMGECYKHKISLNHEELYGVSICEFCKQEFSQNELKCPKCHKLRKYGMSKLVRYKPVWIDHENAEELKAKSDWEERTGRR